MSTTDVPKDEVAQLREERDVLRSEVDSLHRKAKHRGWWRRTIAALLVFLACLSFVVAVPGIWARRNFLDTDRFVSRVGPLIEEPEVQAAVTSRLTSELMQIINPKELFEQVLPERGDILAVPLANAVRGFVHDRVESFVATDRFEQLWNSALELAHQTAVKVLRDESQVVRATEGQVTLDLIPVVDAVLKEITSASPEILGRTVNLPDVSVGDIPKTAITRLENALNVDLPDNFGQITVYDDGKVKAAQDAVKLFDRVVVVLLPLSILLAGAALFVSHRRRRTLLQLTVGISLGMVVLRRVAFAIEPNIAELPPTAEGKAAAEVVVKTFLVPLTTFAEWVLWGAAAIIVVALLSGPYPWAVSLRRRTTELARRIVSTTGERARDEATVAWVHAHRDALLAGGIAAGVLVLWTASLSWLGLLVVAALVGVYELVVYRIAGSVGPVDITQAG